MAEAFAKTFKRDCVQISPTPNVDAALALIDCWMEDYSHSTVIPAGLSLASFLNPSRVRLKTVNSTDGSVDEPISITRCGAIEAYARPECHSPIR
jgi:hypothetical protein